MNRGPVGAALTVSGQWPHVEEVQRVLSRLPRVLASPTVDVDVGGGHVRRFHRFISIDRFRYFRDWTSSEDDDKHSFGRRTVIYGPNGSGKSTVADLFHRIELAQLGADAPSGELNGVVFELTDGSATWTQRGDEEFPPVAVFGRRYVERNLRRAFEDPDAVGEALYVIGPEQVEIDKQIEESVARLEAKEEELSRQKSEVRAATKVVEARTEAIQGELNAFLGRYASNTYNKTYFNKTKVARLIAEHASTEALSDTELEALQRELEADFDEQVTLPSLPELDELNQQLEVLAAHDVTARAIERLANNHELAEWAHRGLALHDAGDRCAFCDGEVRKERLGELGQHFDRSYLELESKLEAAKGEVNRLDGALADVEDSLANLLEGTSATAQWLTRHRPEIDRVLDGMRRWVQAANETIALRERHRFDVVKWDPPATPDWTAWQQLVAQAQQENAELAAKREDVEKARAAAEQAILGHVAATHRDDYNKAQRALSEAEKAREAIQSEISELEDALRSQRERQRDQRDGEPLARHLTASLQRHLGFRKLHVKFVREPDRAGFRILRGDAPAHDLSEGERGAIAFLHFLTMLHSDRFDPDAPGTGGRELAEHVVVIDDPVSSFDNDTIVGAFTHLWEAFKDEQGLRCAQLIVLTHNFHFLQLWRREFDKALTGKDLRKAAELNCEVHELPQRRVAVLELRPALTDDEEPRRYSRLRDLTTGRPGTSEYHLLFQHVGEAVQRNEEGLALLAGNAGRRLLESFVLWKRPDERDMPTAAKKLAEPTSLPTSYVQRVIKTLHMTSHREEIAVDGYPYVGDVLEELRALLAFMCEVDEDHYLGMCRATGVSPGPSTAGPPGGASA